MDQYKPFYLKELLPTIDRVTMDMIRNLPSEASYGEIVSPTDIVLHAIIAFADRIRLELTEGGKDE